jgi:hypothetical protein
VTWLAWRQFRVNALLGAAITVGIVVVLVATRPELVDVGDVGRLSSELRSLRLLGTFLIAVPAFIGAFWGAPLLATELEAGTQRLAWTQSVTRTRWLATKLVVVSIATVVLTGAFSFAFTWWSEPLDDLGNRIGTANFGQRGITPIAYALFAVALGTLAGTVLSRTLPAMAVTVVGFVAVRFAFQELVRSHLVPTVTALVPTNNFGTAQGGVGHAGWILSSRTVDARGRPLSAVQIEKLIRESCNVTRSTTAKGLSSCADRIGLRDAVTMHSAGQFWSLQLWEAAAFVAIAAVLMAASFWWLPHRSA